MTQRQAKRLRGILVGAVAIVLTGCTGSPAPKSLEPTGSSPTATPIPATRPPATPVNFILAFTPSGYDAPYALAQEKGWFKDAGLEVKLIVGTGSGATLTALGLGKADMGTADLGSLVAVRAQGVPVRAFGAVFAKSPFVVAVHADIGIKTPADLVGKSIAVTTGGADALLLPAFLAANNLTGKVKINNVASAAKTGTFLARQVDGFIPLLCGTGIVIQQQDTSPWTIFPFNDYGVALMQLGFVANDTYIGAHPNTIRSFMTVAAKAWGYAAQNIDETVAAMGKVFPEIPSDTVKLQLKCSFEYLQSANTKGTPFGYMSPADWISTIDLMNKYAGAKTVAPEEYYTNDFISK